MTKKNPKPKLQQINICLAPDFIDRIDRAWRMDPAMKYPSRNDYMRAAITEKLEREKK